jgi:ATP-dependent exoDNAse (exonuclease V) alpha subunit
MTNITPLCGLMTYKKKKYKEYKSGRYRPVNYQKFGQTSCIYRSSYELKFLMWCDNNPKVTDVKYEKVIIPYMSKADGRMHRYYVDCRITMREKGGPKTYLIEIKPYKQTQKPKPSKRKKKQTILYENLTYLVNRSKWDAAEQYCKHKGYRWCILTEKGIFIDGVFTESEMF